MKVEFVCVVLILLIKGIHGLGNPYNILGVKRNADLTEIKKNYKKLAKEWHPDKNKDPSAESKFVEINQAYELLTDPERRQQFDRFGTTEDTPNFRQQHDYSHYKRFDPFDDLFNFGGGQHSFKFHFNSDDTNIFHKQSITTKAYENNVVPNSAKVPFLILFYSDWCFSCLHTMPIWRRIVEEMEPVGINVATVHYEHEKQLARKIGVTTPPYLIMVLDGHPYHYKDSMQSAIKMLEFVKSKFPFDTVLRLNEPNQVATFLSGWGMDNKIRVLIFGKLENVRLRYMVTAFQFRDRAVTGYVEIGMAEMSDLQRRLGVQSSVDTVLVFHENSSRPVATLAMRDIPTKTLQDIIESNQYLTLPRLSSQTILDALCPIESVKSRKHLCVVLVTENRQEHEPYRQSMRQFAQEYPKHRLNYLYIFQERQKDFIQALTQAPEAPPDTLLHVVIIWRRNSERIKYEWLPEGWDFEAAELNRRKDKLKSTINRLLGADEALSYEATVKELLDEGAQGFLGRLLTKLLYVSELLREHTSKADVLPAISVLLTVLFIVAGGYLMSYLVKLEEQSIQAAGTPGTAGTQQKNKAQGGRRVSETPQLRVHELRAETYNGLVRLLKPGCRTVVLLVDRESKAKLLPKFHRAVWPYRRNKSLQFAFLHLEKGLHWYRDLITLSLPDPRPLKINPRNCIGTVLSLNGYRKYFCIHHHKHPEKPRSKLEKFNKSTDGAFMGFDSSDSESGSDVEVGRPEREDSGLLDSKVLLEEQLLDGLSNWLDRLFEGSTQRYYINYWPDFSYK